MLVASSLKVLHNCPYNTMETDDDSFQVNRDYEYCKRGSSDGVDNNGKKRGLISLEFELDNLTYDACADINSRLKSSDSDCGSEITTMIKKTATALVPIINNEGIDYDEACIIRRQAAIVAAFDEDHESTKLQQETRNKKKLPYQSGYKSQARFRTTTTTNHYLSGNSLFFLIIISLISPLIMSTCLVEAGFWTFYFPNFLKPSGYKELTDKIADLDREINLAKDTYADIEYFWKLMKNIDNVDKNSLYPEESVCTEIFRTFRSLAVDYAAIDYEHFMKPMDDYHKHLTTARAEWYPDGEKSKTILPREWEQNLIVKDLETKIFWHSKLTQDEDLKKKRERMVEIWQGVRRGLDNSLDCLYLKYAYRQMAQDINQLALEMNLKSMNQALMMVQSAFKRIAKFKSKDEAASDKIVEQVLGMNK